MGIPREQIQRVLDAGHPDEALVGVPVGLLREILASIPLATLPLPACQEAAA